jgi:hypothetical protein
MQQHYIIQYLIPNVAQFFDLLITVPVRFSLSLRPSSGTAWFFVICAAFVSTDLVEVLHI